MHENLEDIDLATCSRRARRWAIGLMCLLAVNGSLVALALAGFGPAQPRPVAAARPMSTPLPAPKQAAAPLGTVPVPVKPEAPAGNWPESPNQQPSVPAVRPVDPPALPPDLRIDSADSLILMNPATTGGEVHFAIDGVVHRLNAGEYLALPGRRQRRVEFHRGDDFGYASQEFGAGPLAFAVGEMGWTLSPLDADAARELLSTGRGKSR